MKHCYLCRWSFNAVVPSLDGELAPVLKCRPEGIREAEQYAIAICKYYDPEEYCEEFLKRKKK